MNWVGVLLTVVGVLLLTAGVLRWLAPRLGPGGSTGRRRLRLLETLSLGPGRGVALLVVGRRVLVVGLADRRLVTLDVLQGDEATELLLEDLGQPGRQRFEGQGLEEQAGEGRLSGFEASLSAALSRLRRSARQDPGQSVSDDAERKRP